MKIKAELVSVKIAHDGTEYDIADDKAYFTSHSDQCDMCGSHGEVELSVDCPCGKDHDIIMSSW